MYESRTGKEISLGFSVHGYLPKDIGPSALVPQPTSVETILPEALAGSQPRRSLPHIELKITTISS